MTLSLFYVAFLVCSLPQLLAAGPNAEVKIDVVASSPPCGLSTGNSVEIDVMARKMDGVRQIKFEFSWTPPMAIDSISGSLGTTTEAEAFIAPGPPQIIEDGQAEWGVAVFGGEGLAGEGHLVHLSFSLAVGLNPAMPIEVRLDIVSLGPSYAERDTVRPIQSATLANYCDEQNQALERGVFLRLDKETKLFSPMGNAGLVDQSSGETSAEVRLYESGQFAIGEAFTWEIDNLGPGVVYALLGEGAVRIEGGARQQVSTTSDERGNSHLLLDSESVADAAQTTAMLKACERTQSLCAEGQVTWRSSNTAILTPLDSSRPKDLRLIPNYPNPFNAGTMLSFTMPSEIPLFAQLDIFNMAGQKIATPFAAKASPGHHSVQWDGRSSTGLPAASGLYIYRLRTDSAERRRTMLLLR